MDGVCPDTLSDFRDPREIGIKTGLRVATSLVVG